MELSKKTMQRLALLITFTLLLYWALTHTARFMELVSTALALVTPFLLGACIAYVLGILLRALERGYDRLFTGKHAAQLRRGVCIVLSLVLVVGVMLAVILLIVPELEQTAATLRAMSPVYWSKIIEWVDALYGLAAEYELELPALRIDPAGITAAVRSFLAENAHGFVDQTVSGISSVVGAVVNLVLALVFALYLLAQKETLSRQANAVLNAFLPARTAQRIRAFLTLADQTFTSFVTGQLTEAVIIGSLCFIGMLVLKMPYAAAISVLIGFTALIPVFGAFIGTAVGAVLILVDTPIKAVWFMLFIIVLQQLEGDFIYPRVVGKSVGLPGIWVLVAVTIGGAAFGILGMLFAVPITSIAYTMLRRETECRLGSTPAETAPPDAPRAP